MRLHYLPGIALFVMAIAALVLAVSAPVEAAVGVALVGASLVFAGMGALIHRFDGETQIGRARNEGTFARMVVEEAQAQRARNPREKLGI